jgi:hypothetical protein
VALARLLRSWIVSFGIESLVFLAVDVVQHIALMVSWHVGRTTGTADNSRANERVPHVESGLARLGFKNGSEWRNCGLLRLAFGADTSDAATRRRRRGQAVCVILS